MQHFNGLLNPTKGEVFIDGIDINKKKDKKTLNARRSVGMVFQYPEQQLFEESILRILLLALEILVVVKMR